uniref:Amine oxidase domain-containing protein n=1 Tax=Phaeodactylum tricornutum TaxID=2850 RepID=A0A8J9S7R2_PHATR
MPLEDSVNKHVVIVGAGMAGLACAREILSTATDSVHVTMVEASQAVGGRIRSHTEADGHVLELGAEYVHGSGTILTSWIDEFRQSGVWGQEYVNTFQEKVDDGQEQHPFFEHIFTLSHADGGGRPDETPTKDGKYGMYSINDELVMFNDPRIEPLNQALESILDLPADASISVEDALKQNEIQLSKELYDLARASYGNTAGCSDLSKLSLSMLQKFEHHWEVNEREGDYRMPHNIGISGIVGTCHTLLEQDPRFTLKLGWEATRIIQDDGSACVSSPNDCLHADAIVVTVPPPMYSRIQMELPEKKRLALEKVGFENAIKIRLSFSCRFWPELVQSIICANQAIPEIWFREYRSVTTESMVYVATAFLVSTFADDFAGRLANVTNLHQRAADLMMTQLSSILSVAIQDIEDAFINVLYFDWSNQEYARGGYMHARVGMQSSDLEALAAPSGCLFFAGEATNTEACCTIQAAMETGIRAANQILTTGFNQVALSSIACGRQPTPPM